MTRERHAVVVFEREAPLRGGQGAGVTPMDIGPSMLSNVEDAVAWYGDTAVPRLADASRFLRRAAACRLGPSLIDQRDSVARPAGTYRQPQRGRGGQAAAAAALNGVIGASGECRLVFSSAPARLIRVRKYSRRHTLRCRARL